MVQVAEHLPPKELNSQNIKSPAKGFLYSSENIKPAVFRGKALSTGVESELLLRTGRFVLSSLQLS
jgi:hypothetical protein